MGTLNVSQAVLKNALNIVSRAVASRATLPVLENVLFKKMDGDFLTLSATNLEIGITTRIPAKYDDGFTDICLPAKTVLELVGTLPNDTVEISVDPKTMSAKIVSGNSKSNVKGLSADEFPYVQSIPAENAIALPDDFSDAVSRVVVAASTDDSRPVLTGVNIELKENKIVLSAADGFRMAMATVDVDYSGEKISLLVPANAMREYAKMAKDTNSSIAIGSGSVIFNIGENILVSQVLEGKFPLIEEIIPKKFSTEIMVVSAVFRNAIKQARIFSRDGNNSIVLHVEQDSVLVDGKGEIGQSSTSVSAQVTGDKIKIAFNAAYIADGIENVKNQSTIIRLVGPTSPGMFTADDDYLYVAMPMFIE